MAVWDFYNTLTHSDNHHRYRDGQIDYVTSYGDGTLYYDSDGDDHPNPQGNGKATDEFLPLLNVFYNRWINSEFYAGSPTPTGGEGVQPTTAPGDSGGGTPILGEGLIDGFDSDSAWEAFMGDPARTALVCAPEAGVFYAGSASLRMDFQVPADDWATCAQMYDQPRDWTAGEGLAFYLRASSAGLSYEVIVHGGTPDNRSTYAAPLQTPEGSADGWVLVQVLWGHILRVAWEENPGTPVDPASVTGVAFGLNPQTENANVGTIWVDELSLFSLAEVVTPTQPPGGDDGGAPLVTESGDDGGDNGGLCSSPALLVLGLGLAFVWMARRKYK